MNKESLLKEINEVFPFIEMPLSDEIFSHKKGCYQCDSLLKDIELYRGKNISGEVIRLIHQEMSLLSAKAWLWILPHYLKYCLTPEAEYNSMETEFFIYALSPSDTYKAETSQRLALLNKNQINCVIHFLEWCLSKVEWKDFYEEDINKGIFFLKSMPTFNQ